MELCQLLGRAFLAGLHSQGAAVRLDREAEEGVSERSGPGAVPHAGGARPCPRLTWLQALPL